MKTQSALLPIFLLALLTFPIAATAYPIDGFLISGIRRLVYLQLVLEGKIKATPPIPGAQKSVADIRLHLTDQVRDTLLPVSDPAFQKEIDRLFPNLNESYSIAVLDITPGRPQRYAHRKGDRGFQPGSVGKLAVVTAFMTEIQKIYPNSFAERQELMRNKEIRAGKWALYDEHTVPFFNPTTQKYFKRTVQEGDIFTLYEWVDHMLSVSNNGAASVVWREAILMRVFGEKYPCLDDSEAEAYFAATPKSELSDLAVQVVNEPLRKLHISEDEWRLGLLFTRGASNIIPGKGGSIGTPNGLMKFLIALEEGAIVDSLSSLEIKRLMYMTDRRIRYAASTALKEAAVYFKSGSLYKCDPSLETGCGKYMGNVFNYMNSVAIVEHPDSTTYLVTLMSNVLRRNSANDHFALASSIDRIVRAAKKE